MGKVDFIKFINNPELLNNESLKLIKGILDEYPYFQVAHLLYLKNLKNINSPDLEERIHYSSAFISDRQVLFEVLYFIDDSKLYAKSKNQNDSKLSIESKPKEQNNKSIKKNEESVKKTEDNNVNNKFRRQIKDGFEGMANNISDTISSQLKHYSSRNDDELKYSPELFFVEEDLKNKEKEEDILFIDDNIEKEEDPVEVLINENVDNELEDTIEFLEIENKKTDIKKDAKEIFNINDYSFSIEFNDEGSEKDKLISKFVINNPRMDTNNEYYDSKGIDLSEKSIEENNELLSETLIKVYVKQGYFDKAIKAYEKLSLKYPKKNTYFASQIKMIKEFKNKQKNT